MRKGMSKRVVALVLACTVINSQLPYHLQGRITRWGRCSC